MREKIRTATDPEAMRAAVKQAIDLQDRAVESLLNQVYEEAAAGFRRKARNIPGYDPDLTRSTGVYLNWLSAHVADLEHRPAIGVLCCPPSSLRQL